MVPAFKKSVMGQGSVALLLFRFSFPAALGLVSNALYNIVDRFFIGRFAGSAGLGAVGLSFPLTVFIAAVGSLVGIGSSSQMSRFMGEGRNLRAEQVLGTAVTTMAVLSITLTSLGLLNLDVLIGALGAGSELFIDTKNYAGIILLGMPFALMSFSLNCLIRAEGRAKDAMLTLVIGAVVNVFLDWLLVVRLRLGIRGAAAGTAIAQMAAFAWTVLFYFRRSILLTGRFTFRPDIVILREMFRIGLSPFCVKMFYTLCMMFFNNIVDELGGPLAVSAVGIFFCLDELIYIPVFGISDGLAPVVGYNYGARQTARVKRTVIWALGAGTAYFVLSFICAESLAPAMVSLFTDDRELIDITSRAMRIGYMGMPFAAAGVVASSVFLAIGKSGMSLFLNLCRQGLIFLPALMFLPRIMGIDGAWSSFAAVDLGGGLLGGAMLAYLWDSLGGEREPSRIVHGGGILNALRNWPAVF